MKKLPNYQFIIIDNSENHVTVKITGTNWTKW